MKNREIKFRAWNEKDKVMVYLDPLSSFHRMMTWTGLIYRDGKVLDWILLQFTGLKDKNGKEVYEGDIVKRTYSFTKAKKPKEVINQIVYGEDWGAFVFYSKTNIGEGWSRMYGGHKVYPYEVIGNIYENPELLK